MIELEKDDDYILILNETTTAMKFLDDFWRVHAPTGYETECTGRFLRFLLVFCMLAGFVKIAGCNRDLKLATSTCFKMALVCAVMLHWRYRPQCTKDAACKLPFEIKSYPATTYNIMLAAGGFLSCSGLTAVLMKYCRQATDALDVVAGPMCYVLGSVVFTDAPMQDVLRGHAPMLGLAGGACLALKQPQLVCKLECLSTYTAFVFAVIFNCAVNLMKIVLLICLALFILVLFLASFGRGQRVVIFLTEMWRGSRSTTPTVSSVVAEVVAMASTSTGASSLKLVDHNSVRTMPEIPFVEVKATVDKDKDKYIGQRSYKPLWKYFHNHCNINNELPNEKDITAVFTAHHFQCDDPAKAKFLGKELERLGLLDPPLKKKK